MIDRCFDSGRALWYSAVMKKYFLLALLPLFSCIALSEQSEKSRRAQVHLEQSVSEARQVELQFHMMRGGYSKGFMKKHGKKNLRREFFISLTAREQEELLRLCSQMRVVQMPFDIQKMPRISYAYKLYLLLKDGQGKVVGSIEPSSVRERVPSKYLTGSTFYLLPREGVERFREIVHKAVDARDIYFRKLYREPDAPCPTCGERHE